MLQRLVVIPLLVIISLLSMPVYLLTLLVVLPATKAAAVMPSLLKGALFYLAGVVYAQSNSFGIDFLHPREGEVITADSTYTVTWAANGRTGTGTITLFAGETSASLKKLWEIACEIHSSFS